MPHIAPWFAKPEWFVASVPHGFPRPKWLCRPVPHGLPRPEQLYHTCAPTPEQLSHLCPMVCQVLNDCIAPMPHALLRPQWLCYTHAPWFTKAWTIATSVPHALPGLNHCVAPMPGQMYNNHSGLGKPWGTEVTHSFRSWQTIGHSETISQVLANHSV